MSQSRTLSKPTTGPSTGGNIYVRNYDHRAAHRVWVAVTAADRQVFETRERLHPGETREATTLAPGKYDVEVEVDGLRRKATECRIGDGSPQAVLVDAGSGAVSVVGTVE
jgi:hypothetical protein